jgi:hypothetical protein
MSYQQAQEMYHDNSARSPGSQRHQQPLHRQPSRQFDAYGPMPVNLYEDPMARYDTGRLERLNPSLHNNNYAYDLAGSQTWNPNGFANPQALGAIRSTSTSLKTTSRPRAGLPTVSTVSHNSQAPFCSDLANHEIRPGLISSRVCPVAFRILVPGPCKAARCAQKPPRPRRMMMN